MIRVFLLDDHALVRTGYRLILQQEVDMEIVGEAASGEEGLPLIKKLKVGSSRVDLQACKLEYSIVSPK